MSDLIRQTPVHMPPLWKNGSSPLIFLTVCANKRQKIFDSSFAHSTLKNIWADDTNPVSWLVGKYVLMPDHIHLFCAPSFQSTTLESWVRFWKSGFTKAQTQLPKQSVRKQEIFQRTFWDTQMRSPIHYASQWEYVEQNPVRAKLVDSPEEWEFRGEINSFEF